MNITLDPQGVILKEGSCQIGMAESPIKIEVTDLHTGKKLDAPKIEDYNFNVSISELVTVSREMGDKIR